MSTETSKRQRGFGAKILKQNVLKRQILTDSNANVDCEGVRERCRVC